MNTVPILDQGSNVNPDMPKSIYLGIFANRPITPITSEMLEVYDPSVYFTTPEGGIVPFVSEPRRFNPLEAKQALRSLSGTTCAVEIGGTHLVIGNAIIESDGNISIVDTNKFVSPGSKGEGFYKQIQSVHGINNVAVIVAGPVNAEGNATLTNLDRLGVDAGGQPIDMRRALPDASEVRTINDAAAGLTEAVMEVQTDGSQQDTVLWAIFGTGAGGSYATRVYQDGSPTDSFDFIATEAGHVPAGEHLRVANIDRPTRLSGSQTPVESFLGGNALVDVYNALAQGENTVMDAQEISMRASAGDQTAQDVLFNTGKAAAQHVLGLLKLAGADADPERTRIVIVGSVGTKAPNMPDLIRAYIYKSTGWLPDIRIATDDMQMKGGITALALSAEQAEKGIDV